MQTLPDLRRESGHKTQAELAKKLKVQRGTIAKWETGRRYPRPPMLPTVAKALNVTEGDVIAAIAASKKSDAS